MILDFPKKYDILTLDLIKKSIIIMFLTEVRASETRRNYCEDGNDSIVEAERKKPVPFVRANCIQRTYNNAGIIETYDNNEVYKVRPNGMREFIRKLTKEEILENTRKAEEDFNKYKHLFTTTISK